MSPHASRPKQEDRCKSERQNYRREMQPNQCGNSLPFSPTTHHGRHNREKQDGSQASQQALKGCRPKRYGSLNFNGHDDPRQMLTRNHRKGAGSRKCVDHITLCGEAHLRRVLRSTITSGFRFGYTQDRFWPKNDRLPPVTIENQIRT